MNIDNLTPELLSEVLGEEIISSELDRVYPEKILQYTRVHNTQRVNIINIHELVHKCKEWATEKGYEIVETTFMIRIKRVGQYKQKIWEYPREMQDAGIYFSPSFTFKACQWILDNKETK